MSLLSKKWNAGLVLCRDRIIHLMILRLSTIIPVYALYRVVLIAQLNNNKFKNILAFMKINYV